MATEPCSKVAFLMRHLVTNGQFRPVRIVLQVLIFCVVTIWGLGDCSSAVGKQDPIDPGFDAIESCGLSDAELSEGFLALFDGKTKFGWAAATEANWSVSDGEIRVSEGEKGLLRTTSQFDDFELRFDFKISGKTNSGIFIRTSPKPRDPQVDCFEINLASPSESKFFTGSLVNRQPTEDVSEGVDHWFDSWHSCRIVAEGSRIQVWIDDHQTMDYTDPAGEGCLGRGFIGLQLNSGPAAFRNIRLKPIDVDPIFNGSDLTGWSTDQKLDSQFVVTDDGELNILSGKGQIETKKSYGDFIFSMKCQTQATGLNSGVFFRCIPGDLMNGYESQIQNQFKDGDRTNPVDCGTGGIFRRTEARRVNADDGVWFAKTIIATGPHIAVWVNGYQVTDWSDRRDADLNPRRGRRLEAGTIIFQGHDPTTDILMKDIRARELKARNR